MACFVCEGYTAAQMPFCRVHWPEYKDQLKEPWVKALKNEVQKEQRAVAQAAGRVISLEHWEELRLLDEQRNMK
jgi:hypothetical protein